MKRGLTILVVGVLSLIVFVSVAAAASESGVAPVRVEGNPRYADLGCTGENVRIDLGSSYPSGPQRIAVEGGTVTFTINSGSDIDWESSVPVSCVVVKGGNAANVYHYEVGATEDWGLAPPDNPEGSYRTSSLDYYGIATPELPAVALPVAMMIGMVGLVYAVRKGPD